MLIGAQAFQESPKAHAPAIILALTPHLAAWGKLLVDNSLGAAGTSAATIGFEKLGQVGVLYQGLAVMGGGAILGGLVLGAIAAYTIDREFHKAAGFALAGAVLSFFGFMHGEAIGLMQAPLVALSYGTVSLVLFACARAALHPVHVAMPAPEAMSIAGSAD
jgi:AGZA family xanthine/uracil permease-like MFS transporter